MRLLSCILIWFTSEGVMLKRIILILCLLGLTGGGTVFAREAARCLLMMAR